MSVGTKSLIFGVHAFWWHPFTVWLAWVRLYGKWPTWRECVCIFVHDFGYVGCPDMDGDQGRQHPVLGAAIAGFLFDWQHEDLVLFHSRWMAEAHKVRPSRLCWPDKASLLYDPAWFYLLRGRLSGEVREYHRRAIERGDMGERSTEREWLIATREHLAREARREGKAFAWETLKP